MNKLAYDKSVLTKEVLQTLRSNGVSYSHIADKFGVTLHTVKRAMIDYGLLKVKRKKFLDVSPNYISERAEQFNDFLSLHTQGYTFTQISELRGCSASYVGKLFTLNGYKFDSTYKTAKAHEAVKGIVRTYSDLSRRANSNERASYSGSRWETYFADWLSSQSMDFTRNKAVGKYNIDFAVGASVAVELYGGAFHSSGRAAARLDERTRYILNQGWNLYIIWCLSKESGISSNCFNDFITFYEFAGINESVRGQYRVIWSDGDFVSSGSDEADYNSVIIPHAMRHNALSKYRSSGY
jgi:very-short-patch-repair endonuclease/transposase